MFQKSKLWAHYHLRFNPLFRKRLKAVLAQKEWDSSKLLLQQQQTFIKIFTDAVSRSQFYQKLYTAHGVNLRQIQSVDDLSKLPVVTKNDIRTNLDTIYTGNRWLKAKGHTSGSSGTPLVVYRNYRSILEEGAYLWAQRYAFGYREGMKIISMRGVLDKAETERYDPYGNMLYLSSFNLNKENAAWYYQKIQAFAPFAILAYPSTMEILSNLFEELGYSLHVPYTFTSSECLYDYQKEKIEKIFHTTTVDWYGNAERSIALEQTQDRYYHELPLYSVNEYHADYTITTGLINPSFPLIRYLVDDVLLPEDTSIGKLPRIKTILGRYDDQLLLPDGTRIGRIGAAFLDIAGLEYAQIIQTTPDFFDVNLVVNDRFSNDSKQKIVAQMKRKTGPSSCFNLRFVQEKDIIRTPAGKFKLVINTASL